MIRITPALCLMALFAVAGCRTFTDPARLHEVKGTQIKWVDTEATRRNTFIYPQDTKYVITAEPPPDVAMGVVTEAMGKLNYEGLSAEGSAKLTEQIVELGKRTETVMILREALFRLSEMASNENIPAEARIRLYESVIQAAKEIALADRADAEANRLREMRLLGVVPHEKVLGLGPEQIALQLQLDELLAVNGQVTDAAGNTHPTVEAFAKDYVAKNFPDETVGTIRAAADARLRQLLDAIEQARQD